MSDKTRFYKKKWKTKNTSKKHDSEPCKYCIIPLYILFFPIFIITFYILYIIWYKKKELSILILHEDNVNG